MWSTDQRCTMCYKKKSCKDREALFKALSPLVNELNTAEPFVSGPGDGIIIISCHDFAIAPPDGQAP